MRHLLEHPTVTAFDDGTERALDLVRGHQWIDRLFYTASELGNHSIIWHVLAWVMALICRDWRIALRISLALGVESALVNGPIKTAFRRQRPLHVGERPHHLRTPITSSFPSGHATSAFFAARLLGRGRGYGSVHVIAGMVASSRAYVKIHHASDVVAGAFLGEAMGRIARRLLFRHH